MISFFLLLNALKSAGWIGCCISSLPKFEVLAGWGSILVVPLHSHEITGPGMGTEPQNPHPLVVPAILSLSRPGHAPKWRIWPYILIEKNKKININLPPINNHFLLYLKNPSHYPWPAPMTSMRGAQPLLPPTICPPHNWGHYQGSIRSRWQMCRSSDWHLPWASEG